MLNATLLLLLGLAGIAAMFYAFRQLNLRQRGRLRIFETVVEAREETRTEPDALTQWLTRAGYRAEGAALVFAGWSALAAVVGLCIPYLLQASGLLVRLELGLSRLPSTLGELFLPLVYLGPWLLCAMIAAQPLLMVLRQRRQRIAQIEQDLPIYLELFATLSEAGLGFDAALDRILHSQPANRVLASEFQTFQMELLAGRPRIQCLRRLAQRVDAMPLTIFVSALVQAEQIGSGVATVLRRQSDDLRDRRRERVLAQAQTLPVKLLFPLVICFLPGIFVVTLGPIFYQFLQFAEGMMRTRGP
jgi:tight adherence protein C